MINADNIWIPAKTGYIKIKYTCNNMFSGGTPSTSDSRCYENGDIPWIASGKCQDCDVTDETTFITKYGLTHSSTRLIRPNSALIAMTGATCGNAGLLKIRACANQSVFAYETNINNESRFLFYSIIAGRDSILLNQLGGAQAGINGQVCKNIFIPKQPLDKQINISNYLDKKTTAIDSLIEKEVKAVEGLKEYKDSLITKLVLNGTRKSKYKETGVKWMPYIPSNWSFSKIGPNCYLKGRIGWQGLTADEYKDEGPYLITGTDFESGSINWDTCVHITEKRYVEASHIRVRKGDVLITKDGTVGKVAVVEELPNKASLNSGVMLMRNLKGNYINRYLYYVLLSNVFWDWFYREKKENSTIIHLYQEQFEKFSFPIPPKDEQQEIVDYLDKKCEAIDKLMELKKEKIEKLKEYKKSLIYECVTGRREINA